VRLTRAAEWRASVPVDRRLQMAGTSVEALVGVTRPLHMIDPIEWSDNQASWRLDTQQWRIPIVEHDFQRVTWFAVLTALCLTLVRVDDTYAQSPNRGKDEYIRGKDEYMRSCQPCHGTGGRGDGPTAKHLAKPPSDLTGLSESNGGVFPSAPLFEIIDGRLEIALHGPREMPVWGDRYKRELIFEMPKDAVSNDMANVLARRRILELIEYISTVKGK